jgi:hypothetical protein
MCSVKYFTNKLTEHLPTPKPKLPWWLIELILWPRNSLWGQSLEYSEMPLVTNHSMVKSQASASVRCSTVTQGAGAVRCFWTYTSMKVECSFFLVLLRSEEETCLLLRNFGNYNNTDSDTWIFIKSLKVSNPIHEKYMHNIIMPIIRLYFISGENALKLREYKEFISCLQTRHFRYRLQWVWHTLLFFFKAVPLQAWTGPWEIR